MIEQARSLVESHLIFHKSLIDDSDDGSRLDSYIEMIQNMELEEHLAVDDPFDRSIILTFELVMENQMDPWNIDLIKFSREYLKKVRKDDEVDLIAAGRIAFMAWSVLRLQSDKVVRDCEEQDPDDDEFWDDFTDWYGSDDDFEFTERVIHRKDPPIKEMVWRKGKRPVTLMELVDAFETAREEAVMYQDICKQRDRLRKDWEKTRRVNLSDKMHKEDLQGDIQQIWSRISQHNGSAIPIENICNQQDVDDRLMALVCSLHLAKERKIKIWQPKFPYGEIFIKNLTLRKDKDGNVKEEEGPPVKLSTLVTQKMSITGAPPAKKGMVS